MFLSKIITVVLAFTWITPTFADALLFVSPLRVVIEPNKRSTVVSVTNKSKQNRKYKVMLVDQMMGEAGNTSTVDTFAYSAKRMLRYMPREILLTPGQRQLVRIMVRRPADLPAGDYHTHLLFEEEQLKPKEDPSTKGLDEGKFALEIGATYGIAVPIIVQKGKLQSHIQLINAKLGPKDSKQPHILVDLTRTGNSEGFGHLITTQNGKTITNPRNVRIYREANKVTLKVLLSANYNQTGTFPIKITLYKNKKNLKEPMGEVIINK